MTALVFQEPGTIEDLEVATFAGPATDTGSRLIDTDGGVEQPIVWENGSIYLTPRLMDTDVPYPFKYFDHWMLAVKRDDGTFDVYHVPVNAEDG